MAEDKRPLDLALDVFVYVPIGLVVSARDLLPALAARGRERISGKVSTARVVGRFAVQQGQTRAGKAFVRAREDATGRVDRLTADIAGGSTDAAPATIAPLPTSRPPTPTSGPAADALAIPGYDSLSASQVLPRLAGLVPAELEAVRRYEGDHRGRKTILGRIAQLQTAS
jgi:hypothetical protein